MGGGGGLCLHLGHGDPAGLGRHAVRRADLRDVAGRPLNGIIQPSRDMMVRAVTPRRLVRQGVRLRLDRLQPRRHGGAAALRLADGSRPAADDLRHRHRFHPPGAADRRHPPQTTGCRMDALTPDRHPRQAGGARPPLRRRPPAGRAVERDHRHPARPSLGARLPVRSRTAGNPGNPDRRRPVGRHQLQHAAVVGHRRHRPGQAPGAGRDRRRPEAHRAVPALPRLRRRHVAQRADVAGRAGDLREPALPRDLHGGLHRRCTGGPERRGRRRIAGTAHRLYRRHAQRPGPGA